MLLLRRSTTLLILMSRPRSLHSQYVYRQPWIDKQLLTSVLSFQLMNAGRKGQANAVLSEVQNRHDDIRKIERTILVRLELSYQAWAYTAFFIQELHQLFQDMQMLVEQQGTVLTQAEQNAETTVGHLEQGNTMIGKAIRSARATRHVSNQSYSHVCSC